MRETATGAQGRTWDAVDDEEGLIERARADPTAFDLLDARYRERLYRYLRTRVANDEDAADLTQHVFLSAWAALPSYQERGLPFAAWLFRIARNAALNTKRRGPQVIAWDAVPERLLSPQINEPEEQAVRRDTIARLHALLDRLDPDKRELLALRFAAGLTVREIAAVVGGNEEAVKKRLSRTIRALKEHYDER